MRIAPVLLRHIAAAEPASPQDAAWRADPRHRSSGVSQGEAI